MATPWFLLQGKRRINLGGRSTVGLSKEEKLEELARNRKRRKEERARERAAIVIQSHARGYLSRKHTLSRFFSLSDPPPSPLSPHWLLVFSYFLCPSQCEQVNILLHALEVRYGGGEVSVEADYRSMWKVFMAVCHHDVEVDEALFLSVCRLWKSTVQGGAWIAYMGSKGGVCVKEIFLRLLVRYSDHYEMLPVWLGLLQNALAAPSPQPITASDIHPLIRLDIWGHPSIPFIYSEYATHFPSFSFEEWSSCRDKVREDLGRMIAEGWVEEKKQRALIGSIAHYLQCVTEGEDTEVPFQWFWQLVSYDQWKGFLKVDSISVYYVLTMSLRVKALRYYYEMIVDGEAYQTMYNYIQQYPKDLIALEAFCRLYSRTLRVIDEESFYLGTHSLPIAVYSDFIQYLIGVVVKLHKEHVLEGLLHHAERVLSLLHVRHRRRPLCGEGVWIDWFRGMIRRQVVHPNEIGVDHEDPFNRILARVPFLVPLEHRISLFQRWIAQEGDTFPLRDIVSVRRGAIVQDMVRMMNTLPPFTIPVVRFIGADHELEVATGDGVMKEFIAEACLAVFQPEGRYFAVTPEGRYYPHPDQRADPGAEEVFFAIGKLLGLALRKGMFIEGNLAAFFIHDLLGIRNRIDDFAEYDPQVYQQLRRLTTDTSSDIEDIYCLRFAVDVRAGGVIETHELVPGGASMSVVAHNRCHYVAQYVDFFLNRFLSPLTRAFASGLFEMVPHTLFRMFSALEIQQLVGSMDDHIDVSDMQAHASVRILDVNSEGVLTAFWEVMHGMGEEELRAFLRFVTASPRPPLLGFQYLHPPFSIQLVPQERMPSSLTCFNLLKLPMEVDKGRLREKLYLAIKHDRGFDYS